MGAISPQVAAPGGGFAGPSSGPDFLGCPYPSGDIYQTDISGVSPDPNSAAYISAVISAHNGPVNLNGNQGFTPLVNTQVINGATDTTQKLPVHPGNSYDIPFSPIPWAVGYFIEHDGDHHAEVANTQSCKYYEGYKTVFSPTTSFVSMYNNEYIDLTMPFVRPATGALSTATGIPLGLLAVRPEELSAGVILHALGWNAVSNTLNGVAGAPCVNPAGKIDCTDGNAYEGAPSAVPMPYGSHARLQASFDISSFPREAKIIAVAMKTYGLYVYDTGGLNAIILADDPTGTQTQWTAQDAQYLKKIKPEDFDIVPAPLSGEKPIRPHGHVHAKTAK